MTSKFSGAKLPSYTEIHTTSPIAAGLPVLEVVRKLEEEKHLTKDDKIALKEGLYSNNAARREDIVKALCDVELNLNSRFSVKRLKCVLHQNSSGEPSSKFQSREAAQYEIPQDLFKSKNDSSMKSSRQRNVLAIPVSGEKQLVDFDSMENINVAVAVQQVVGEAPQYSSADHFGVLSKISVRLKEFNEKHATSGSPTTRRKLAVLVGCGSFNPLTRMHLRTFYLAKQYLEARHGYVLLGALLSPAHGVTVRERYRTNPSEIIPSPHRLAVAQLLVQNSKWLGVDPWEITRRRAMDYLSLLEHVASLTRSEFPEAEFKIMYLCKANQVPKLSPQAMKAQNFSCICVCRTPESDVLRAGLSPKWNGAIHVVEDTAILDAAMDVVTSRKVRDKIKAGESVEQLVGEKINDYVFANRLGAKMNGLEEWSAEEKQLPKLAPRPPDPILPGQSSVVSGKGGSPPRAHKNSLEPTYYKPSWLSKDDDTTDSRAVAGSRSKSTKAQAPRRPNPNEFEDDDL